MSLGEWIVQLSKLVFGAVALLVMYRVLSELQAIHSLLA